MNAYLSFILRRIGQAIPTMLLIITLAFFLIRQAPGGPFDLERSLPPEIEKNLMAYYNLDKSLFEQYLDYLFGILQGDLGPSYTYRDFTVNELITQGFSYSFKLGMWSIFVALVGGILAGSLAALKRNSIWDYFAMTFAVSGVAVPNFVLAPILVLIMAVWNDWFPAGGWGEGGFQELFLPVLTLGTAYMGTFARLFRASMIETLGSQFIITARAKGLKESMIIWKHAMRSALLPVVSYLGPATVGIITGSLVIEQIFALPGIGRYFIQAALARDYTLVMGTVVFYGGLIIVANLLVDIAYGWLDPKIRVSQT